MSGNRMSGNRMSQNHINTVTLPQVCLIEDDPIMGESLQDRFRFEGFAVNWHRSLAAALTDLQQQKTDLLVSDIRLPDGNGGDLFERLQGLLPRVPPTLFITGYGTVDDAVRLLRLGAVDYVTKPFSLETLIDKMRAHLPPQPAASEAQLPLGVSEPMRRLEATLARLADYDSSVLISGESGVGKEVAARRLHQLTTARSIHPFVAVNCAALPETLMESELFGHEKGAFTGALSRKRGFFEQASNGTLFLDEIGELPLALQGTLLRATQDKAITRLGGEGSVPVDVRLIYATNRDLHAAVAAGHFREDLYYRINVIHLQLPPLRERPDDILWLAEQFLAEHQRRYPERPLSLSAEARQALLKHPWPGNVRELKNSIERASIMSNGPCIEPPDLFNPSLGAAPSASAPSAPAASTNGPQRLASHLQEAERHWIEHTLSVHAWQINTTAQALGISRKTLWEKMKKLAIQRP